MSQEQRHETFPYSVPSTNTNEEEDEDEAWNNLHFLFSENPNYYITTNTGNLQNPSGEGSSKNSSDVFKYQRNFPLGSGGSIASIISQSNNKQLAYDNFHHSIMQGNGYETNSSDTFGYQSDFCLGSQEDIAAMRSRMLPIPGFVNTSTTNNTNNGQSSGEGCSKNSTEVFEYYRNFSLGSGGNIASITSQCNNSCLLEDSGTYFTNATRNPQLAYDNLHRSIMQGNGYETKISDTFGYQSDFCLGSQEDIAAMSSLMLPIPGFVNTSTTNNTNNGQPYISTEASNNNGGFLEEPMTKDTVCQKTQNTNAPSPLSHQQQQPQWTLTKILTNSDVRTGCIVLKRYGIEKHTEELIPRAKGSSGVTTINVYDQDMKSKHTLHLEFGRLSVYLSGNWKKDFVKRRKLREGHMIGFFWDSSASMLQFSVLSREIRTASAEEKQKQQQWTITKILTKTDVSTSWIALSKYDVEEHITEFVPGAKSSSGVSIDVYDQDKESKHTLRLNFRGFYKLSSNWKKAFIERRKLREGEEIGFFWDSSTSMLQFSVISREIRKASAEEEKVLTQ